MSLAEKWASLSQMVHKAIGTVSKKDITHAEAFFTATETMEIAIRNSEILTQNKVDDAGVGFRVAIGEKVGFSCTNTLDQREILKAAENAAGIAKVSSKMPNFTFPAAGRIPKVPGLFDPDIAEMPPEDAVAIAERTITAAEGFDGRVKAKDGRVLLVYGWRGITNTLGVDCEEKETRSLIYLGGVGEQHDEVTGICDDIECRRSADLHPERVGETVARKVIELFQPQTATSLQATVIFSPEAASYQLIDVLIDALNADHVVAGRSALTDQLESPVASDHLTITDNAILEGGFASRSFDDEGYPSRNTFLVKRGKLQSFIHNATSATTLTTENTGNASRFSGGFDMARWIIGNGYRAQPEIYPSNLQVQLGSKTQDELVSETDEGVLVDSMAGFPQAGSGMISAQLSRAFYIKNGEVQHAVKGGMISGVAFDWFKKISGIGRDSKQFQNAVIPSLRVDEVKVIGA
jgi:PmbA protein